MPLQKKGRRGSALNESPVCVDGSRTRCWWPVIYATWKKTSHCADRSLLVEAGGQVLKCFFSVTVPLTLHWWSQTRVLGDGGLGAQGTEVKEGRKGRDFSIFKRSWEQCIFFSFANFRWDLIVIHLKGKKGSWLGGEASGAGEGLVRETLPQVSLGGGGDRKCTAWAGVLFKFDSCQCMAKTTTIL